MKRVLVLVTMFVLGISVCTAQFFPKSSLGEGDEGTFRTEWYSNQLQALQESSLFKLADTRASHSYRFLWLRSFHHPIAIRVDIQPDGTGFLTIKMTSGAGGYAPGKLVTKSYGTLNGDQTKALLSLVNEVGFWKATTIEKGRGGMDGAQWIIEGVHDGNYHIIDRWTPKSGPAYELGMFLAFKLAKLNVPPEEIY